MGVVIQFPISKRNRRPPAIEQPEPGPSLFNPPIPPVVQIYGKPKPRWRDDPLFPCIAVLGVAVTLCMAAIGIAAYLTR